jgi:hypothetical protein
MSIQTKTDGPRCSFQMISTYAPKLAYPRETAPSTLPTSSYRKVLLYRRSKKQKNIIYPNRESNSGLSHNSMSHTHAFRAYSIRTTVEQAFSLWSGYNRRKIRAAGLTTLTTASLISIVSDGPGH